MAVMHGVVTGNFQVNYELVFSRKETIKCGGAKMPTGCTTSDHPMVGLSGFLWPSLLECGVITPGTRSETGSLYWGSRPGGLLEILTLGWMVPGPAGRPPGYAGPPATHSITIIIGVWVQGSRGWV